MNKSDVRYFVYCPRGFSNERTLMASDDTNIIQEMYKRFDDGMAGTFEEVQEKEAKRLFYGNQVEPAIDIAIYNSEKDYADCPKWEELLYFLLLDSRLKYQINTREKTQR